MSAQPQPTNTNPPPAPDIATQLAEAQKKIKELEEKQKKADEQNSQTEGFLKRIFGKKEGDPPTDPPKNPPKKDPPPKDPPKDPPKKDPPNENKELEELKAKVAQMQKTQEEQAQQEQIAKALEDVFKTHKIEEPEAQKYFTFLLDDAQAGLKEGEELSKEAFQGVVDKVKSMYNKEGNVKKQGTGFPTSTPPTDPGKWGSVSLEEYKKMKAGNPLDLIQFGKSNPILMEQYEEQLAKEDGFVLVKPIKK